MEQVHKKNLLGLTVGLVILCLGAIAVGTVLVSRGSGLLFSAFAGAFAAVFVLVAIFAVYRLWARIAWGAPFKVGDTVRLVRGPHAGQRAVVTRLGQGLDVDVLLESEQATMQQVPWRAVRRESHHVR